MEAIFVRVAQGNFLNKHELFVLRVGSNGIFEQDMFGTNLLETDISSCSTSKYIRLQADVQEMNLLVVSIVSKFNISQARPIGYENGSIELISTFGESKIPPATSSNGSHATAMPRNIDCSVQGLLNLVRYCYYSIEIVGLKDRISRQLEDHVQEFNYANQAISMHFDLIRCFSFLVLDLKSFERELSLMPKVNTILNNKETYPSLPVEMMNKRAKLIDQYANESRYLLYKSKLEGFLDDLNDLTNIQQLPWYFAHWKIVLKLAKSIILLSAAYYLIDVQYWRQDGFRFFVSVFQILCLYWMVPLSIFVFNAYNIPYIEIFELPSAFNSSLVHHINQATNFTLVYALCIIIFFIPKATFYSGMALLIFTVYNIIFPIPDRLIFLRDACWPTFISPFLGLANYKNLSKFSLGFFGDVVTSISRGILVDFVFFSFLFLIQPSGHFFPRFSKIGSSADVYRHFQLIVILYGLLIRVAQCMQGVARVGIFSNSSTLKQRSIIYGNALKYASAILSAVVGYIVGLMDYDPRMEWRWYACLLFSTSFQFLWDIFVDWGLVVNQAIGLDSSGRRLLYPKFFYPCVALLNLFLRFAWTVQTIPNIELFIPEDIIRNTLLVQVTLYVFEIFRRCVWGFIRVELEASKLTGKQAIEDASGDRMDSLVAIEISAFLIFVSCLLVVALLIVIFI